MRHPVSKGSWLFLPVLLLWMSCASTTSGPSPAKQRQEIKQLIYNVRKNPRSATAFRDLGAALFEMKWYKFAVKSLVKSYRLNSKDAETLYYIAQLLELRNQTDRAMQIYSQYSKVSTPVEYKQMMEAQYQLLTRANSRADIHRMMQSEALLQIKTTSPKSVAVLPLKYMGLDNQYGPMGKGVAEMIMTDLSQIKSLNVVERVRVQALYDEMNLSQTGLMDVTSTPKMGKLLGAGKIVQGNFAVIDNRDIHLDVTCTDIIKDVMPEAVTMKDRISQLFNIEKDLVFRMIDQLGITPSPEERQRIQYIPTKNIQAFMAYCMGLEMEDQGDFSRASQYYQQAVELDPGYKEAKNKQGVNQSMAVVSTRMPTRGISRTPTSPKVPLAPNVVNREMLINNRLQVGGRNIGATFIPGQDSRKSTQEFTTTQLLSETLGERITNPLDLLNYDAEALFETIALPELPKPPEPPSVP